MSIATILNPIAGSSVLRSLDSKDRRMLLIVLGFIVLLFVLLGLLTPGEDADNNRIPNSYLPGKHGAKAAYILLERSGYAIERWEGPLSELAIHADSSTVLILAEPGTLPLEDRHAVTAILNKGGHVLATGFIGGLILPGNHVAQSKQASFAACEAKPQGLQPLAGTGPIWIVPATTWNGADSETRVAYTCAGEAVVVEYPVEKGRAIWWASSTPLENGSIERGQNLELLLNSVGPPQGQHIYWDESLHGRVNTPWDYVKGPVWPLFLFGVFGMALLVILSFSRHSGPVRPLPQRPRTTPIEFLDALGSLYRSTGAASTALQIAWDRFRTQTALLTGQRSTKLDARELAAALKHRFGNIAPDLEANLIEAEEACWEDSLRASRALILVRALRQHEETFRAASARRIAQVPAATEVKLVS
jgi:uncharacterized protein DUF4350